MANNTKRKTNRSQSKKTTVKKQEMESTLTSEQVAQAQQLLPPYQPIDFSTPPSHLEVINKKIRALKKKLRKLYDIEKALETGSKKVTKEQQDSLSNKLLLERTLADFEEIKASLSTIDISAQLRLLLGVFFAAQSTSSESLISFSTLLLPPSSSSPDFSPHQELQHACEVANQFLSNSTEQIFDNPPVTFNQLQDEVKTFLIPKKESPTQSTTKVNDSDEPKQVELSEVTETKSDDNETVTPPKSESTDVKNDSSSKSQKEEPQSTTNGVDVTNSEVNDPNTKEVKPESDKNETKDSNNNQKKNTKKRGGRNKPRGNRQGDRGFVKRGRGGKPNQGDRENQTSNKSSNEHRGDKRGRGRGTRGRGNMNRNKSRDQTQTTKDKTNKS